MSRAESGGDAVDDDFLFEKVVQLQTRVETLEERLDERDRRIEELEDRVVELDERTDMLRMVEQTEEMSATQRRTALLQHLYREAQRNGGSTSIDRDRAEDVLHYPDIDRTTFYTDFDEIERLVGDKDICEYQSDGVDARLVLDLTAGDLPETVHRRLNGGA